jgi:hypothetical protein
MGEVDEGLYQAANLYNHNNHTNPINHSSDNLVG